MTAFAPAQLGKLATVTTSGTVTLGKHNSFNASSGALVATLPALSSGPVAAALNVGQIVRTKISKSKTDTSVNAVTVTCSSTDTFEGGATSQVLYAAGEKLTLVAQTIPGASGPVWVVEEHTAPRDTQDSRYVPKGGPSPALARDFNRRALPKVLTSPPATTAGSSSTSTVTGSVVVSPFEPGAFTYLGGRAIVTNYASPSGSGLIVGAYPQITSPSPVTVDFWLDSNDTTGRFEIYWGGTATFNGMRVAIQQPDGSWGYITTASTFSHTNGWADLVTLGAAGTYHVRLELPPGGAFYGVYVGPTDTVSAGPTAKRWMVVGDSFTEPTLDDSGSFVAHDGWVPQLAYLTGYDMWCAGSGGTGYLNPNSGGGRVKFRDRLANDILAFKPDGILWAGGINDSTGYTPAAIGAEALACFQQAKTAGVAEQVVLSPFWSRELISQSPPTIPAMSDAIKASAASLGLPYLNLLELFDPTGRESDWAGSTLQAATSANATSLSVASIPQYFLVNYVTKAGWYIRIGAGTNSEIRRVTNVSGTGPYTLTVGAMTFAHAAGDPIANSGPSYMTGSGRQGTTTGIGNSDRFIGAGGTHPTRAGHGYIARRVAAAWSQAIAG